MSLEPIMPAGLMFNVRPITPTSALEQLPDSADVIMRNLPLGKDDAILLISVSGRNPLITEKRTLAQKKRG